MEKKWKSTGVFNYSDYYSMKGIEDTKRELSRLKDDKKNACLFTR